MHYSRCQDVVLETFQSQFLELASAEQLFLRDLNLRFEIMGMLYNIILLQLKDREAYEQYNKSQTNLLECSHWTQVRLLPCVVSHWVSQSLNPLVEICLNWICQRCYMDFSDFLHGFVKIYTQSSISCYIDLSNLIQGFLWNVIRICQSFFLPNKSWSLTKI